MTTSQIVENYIKNYQYQTCTCNFVRYKTDDLSYKYLLFNLVLENDDFTYDFSLDIVNELYRINVHLNLNLINKIKIHSNTIIQYCNYENDPECMFQLSTIYTEEILFLCSIISEMQKAINFKIQNDSFTFYNVSYITPLGIVQK